MLQVHRWKFLMHFVDVIHQAFLKYYSLHLVEPATARVFEKNPAPPAKYLASNRARWEREIERERKMGFIKKSFRELYRSDGTVLRSSGGIPLVGLLTLTNPSTPLLLAAQKKLRLCIEPWRLLQSQIVKCSRKFSRVLPLLSGTHTFADKQEITKYLE